MNNVIGTYTFKNYNIALQIIVKLDKFINDDYLLKHNLKYNLKYNPKGEFYNCFIMIKNKYSIAFAYYLLGKISIFMKGNIV